jgi:integrase
MGRKSVWPPRITLHAASGQARVRWQNRDYYLGQWDSEEARGRYAALLLELTAASAHLAPTERPFSAHLAPAPAPVQALLVCDVLARWCLHARTYYSERGRERQQYAQALRPMERLFGLVPAREFDAVRLRQLQQAMIDGSWMTAEDRAHPMVPATGGWARRVVNSRVSRVRTVWRWAEGQGLVPGGTWQALRAVEPVRRNRPGARDPVRARTTTLGEVKAVCRHLTATLRACLLVQFWTGMRSAEVRTMRAGDVDTSGAVWRYVPRAHKTDYLGHSRAVFIGPRAQSVLRPLLALALLQGPDGAVFPSTGRGKGRCYTLSGYSHAMRAAGLAAGLPHWRPYLTRGAARMRASRLMGDEAARSLLGHKHLDTSLSYGCIDEQLARDAAARLG